jgi:hypothetical protein
MPQNIKSLLADLQRVVEQISYENGKQEAQPGQSDISTDEPDTAPAPNNSPDEEEIGEVKDLIIKTADLVIGVEKNNTINLEAVEVTPEPDGRVSIMIRAKKEQHRQASDFKQPAEQKLEGK